MADDTVLCRLGHDGLCQLVSLLVSQLVSLDLLWYLSQELSILGLFDSEVSEEDKVQMAQALVGCPRP